MIDEIAGAGPGRLDRSSPGAAARTRKAERGKGGAGSDEPLDVAVPGGLRALMERVKQADVHRKERVHAVLEKLQRGELVTSETVRLTAEGILRTGI